MRKILLLVLLLFVFSIASAATESNISFTKVVGVQENDDGTLNGVVADLTVEVRPGNGNVYIDTLPLTKIDTQASARLAKEVACDTLEKDCSKIDFLYTLRSPHVIIGGPSAGAAMTASTMAALQGLEINKDVIFTGTINPAGSVGFVGGLYEKIEAASKDGAEIVLIPHGQEVVYDEIKDKELNLVVEGKKMSVEVISVYDITDAYKYLTGYTIERPIVNSPNVSAEKVNNAMQQLSSGLLPEANKSYERAENAFKTSTITDRDYVLSILEKSEEELNKAEQKFDEQEYYSSSSFAVRSSIYSLYAYRLLEYSKTENASYVEGEINNIENGVADFEVLFLKDKTVDSVDDIEVFSVVIDRIRESEDTIDEAKAAYNKSDYDTALYLVSYAEVRKNTAYQWLTLINEFTGNESFVFDPSKVEDLALARIDQSRNAIVYAQTISEDILVKEAEKTLNKAEEAYNEGNYVFAVFEAAKARATANLALEARSVSNETVDDKINQLENEALIAIQNSEEKGLTPILALSYLEFASNFYENDPAQAMIYLSYSKEMAQISEEITNAVVGNYFIKSPEPVTEKYYQEIVRLDVHGSFIESIILLLTGISAGTMATLAYLESKQPKKKR